jgi:hypothetical protein
MVLFHIVKINFGQCVLVAAYNHRRSVAPQHETVIRKVFKHIFFCRQIEKGVGMMIIDAQHDVFLRKWQVFYD